MMQLNSKGVLTSVFVIISLVLQAQNACNMTVDAGPDITICLGDQGQLTGVVTGGNNPAIEWTPADGLSDPTILNPLAGPVVTTTYTLSATANSANLITNGDFETGNINPATSNYTQVTSPLDIGTNAPNFYGVLSVPQIVQAFGCQPDIGDYTMVIHGSTGVGVDFWCQTINVTPNTDYKLSFKVFGIPYFFAPAPNIVLKINGNQVGSLQAPNGVCAEDSADFTWNSGGSTTADVCLANSTVAGLGSMCSVDDITMVECCLAEDEVIVTVVEPIIEQQMHFICPGGSVEVGGETFSAAGMYEVMLMSEAGCDSIIEVTVEQVEIEAFIQADGELNCILDQVTLDGSLSSATFGIQSYQWTTLNGSFQGPTNNATATISGPGTYTLIVSTTNGMITCTDELSIDIGIDTVHPIVVIEPLPVVGCQDTALTITLKDTIPGNATISWTTWNGNIYSGGNSRTPLVQIPGIYTVSVFNPTNGCLTLDSVQVSGGGDVPVVQLLTLPTFTCRDSQVQVLVTVVSPDSNYTLVWNTANGQIVSGSNDTLLTVSTPGTYTITVIDTLTNCQTILNAQVQADTMLPIISLLGQDTLGCAEDSLFIAASLPIGLDSTQILWTTQGGVILSSTDSLQIWVGSQGVYQLSVENLRNGCRDSASIMIDTDGDLPIAMAGPDLVIDCLADTVFPTTTGTSTGMDFAYFWIPSPGMVVDAANLNTGFLSAGNYILQVTNMITGCSSTDTVLVSASQDAPDIAIELPEVLNCNITSTLLSGIIQNPANTVFSWNGPAGGITLNGNTLSPTVQSPGIYTLTVIDTTNQCESMAFVEVLQDTSYPIIVFAMPGVLDCDQNQLTLDASLSQPNTGVSFQWTTANGGQILSGGNGPAPLINAGGLYILTITNNQNGCETTDTLEVIQDANLPVVSIQAPELITCINETVNLSASVSPDPGGASFQWTTSGGQFIGATTNASAEVGGPGLYQVEVNILGCIAIAEVMVEEDVYLPQYTHPPTVILDCINTMSTLTPVTTDSLIALNTTWVNNQQVILSTDIPLLVDAEDIYTFIWENPANGCRDSLSVLVTANTVPPLAQAGPDQNASCSAGPLMLDGSGSVGVGLLTYLWSTVNGQIISAADQAMIEINQAGNYILTVTDEENGCTATDTVEVILEGSATYQISVDPAGCGGALGSIYFDGADGGTVPYQLTVSGTPGSIGLGESLALGAGSWMVNITDGAGCSFDTLITVDSQSDLILNAPSVVVVINGAPATITLSGNFNVGDIADIIWNPAEFINSTSNPLVWETTASSATNYTVTVITQDGCEATVTLLVDVQDFIRIYFPNAFSPNNVDGINDSFYPQLPEGSIPLIKRMTIFDRWGNHLFERADFPPNEPSFGWDGTYRGKNMKPGVYVYAVEVLLPSGELRIYKGDVTIF